MTSSVEGKEGNWPKDDNGKKTKGLRKIFTRTRGGSIIILTTINITFLFLSEMVMEALLDWPMWIDSARGNDSF